MIAAAAVCPCPPVLFRELTGREDVAAELREACQAALASVLETDPDLVLVLGGGDSSRAWDAALEFDVRSFGTTTAPHVEGGLPLSLGVARRLLDEAGWRGPRELHTVADTASPEQVAKLAQQLTGRDGRVVVLAMGEGSARRGEKAPGYLDDRAFGFDAALGRALGEADLDALVDIEPALADELMVSGRAPFAVLATAVRAESRRTPHAQLRYEADPWGVMYLVATWLTDLSGG